MFRLYNVDVPPDLSYLYQHDLFSLARCSLRPKGSRLVRGLMDDGGATEYELPNLTRIRLDVKGRKESGLPKFTDKLESIIISKNDDKRELRSSSEAGMFVDLESTVAWLDPNFMSTQDGDAFLFPYLIGRQSKMG